MSSSIRTVALILWMSVSATCRGIVGQSPNGIDGRDATCKTSSGMPSVNRTCLEPLNIYDFPFGFVSTKNKAWCQMVVLNSVEVKVGSVTCTVPTIERYDLDNWNLCKRLMAAADGNSSQSLTTACFEKSNVEWTSPGPVNRGLVYRFGTVRVYCMKVEEHAETSFAKIGSSIRTCKPLIQWPDLSSPSTDC